MTQCSERNSSGPTSASEKSGARQLGLELILNMLSAQASYATGVSLVQLVRHSKILFRSNHTLKHS